MLVVVLAASTFLLMQTQESVVRVMDYGTVLKGVSVGGIDISGMTDEQARQATASIPDTLLTEVQISLDVNDEIHELSAEDISAYTDYDDVIAQAIAYGHTGSFDERKTAADTAKADGIDFPVDVYADADMVDSALQALKEELDASPAEAGFVFMPDGYYLIDGVAYTPDEYNAMKEAAEEAGEAFIEQELVRLADADKPNELRYQFYQDTKYIDGYIPPDADIARFYYTESTTGLVIDIAALDSMIVDAVQTDNYETITAPVEVTDAQKRRLRTLNIRHS